MPIIGCRICAARCYLPMLYSHLWKSNHRVFVEISAHPILLSAVEDSLYHLSVEGTAVPSLRRDVDEQITMRDSLGRLYSLGQPVAWQALYPNRGQCVPLPSYPWQRQRYWLEPAHEMPLDGASGSPFQSDGSPSHPLLGRKLTTALPETLFENVLTTTRLPYPERPSSVRPCHFTRNRLSGNGRGCEKSH